MLPSLVWCLAGDIKSCRTILANLAEHLILREVGVQPMQVGSTGTLDGLARGLHRQFDQGRIERGRGALVGTAWPDGFMVGCHGVLCSVDGVGLDRRGSP